VTLNRYVLDTNVLVSAVLSPNSTASQAYQKALDTGVLLASTQTLQEYEKVLLRPKFDRYISLSYRRTFPEELKKGIAYIQIIQLITDCRDEKDNMYLEVAINGLADALVTGDQDLLILHPYREKLPILTPSMFLSYINNLKS
jgi:putative PIN family toxin of toxin-antitoxin system